MKDFDLNLLQEVVQKINKIAFVPSPQTQEAAAMAQQEGLIQPTQPAPGSSDQPQIGFNEIAQLIQQGIEAMMQAQQQGFQQVLGELQLLKVSGSANGKKKSVAERLDQLEQMLIQGTQSAQPTPQQEQPPAEQQPPQQA
jgi:hypothetical protein